jgi:small-conductance mechanosensitive channel
MRRLLLITLLTVAAPWFANAAATEGATAAAAVDAGDIDALLETLEDPDRRAIFLDRLRTLQALQAEAAESPPRPESLGTLLMEGLSVPAQRAGEQLTTLTDQLASVPDQLLTTQRFLLATENRGLLLEVGSRLLLVLLAGLAGEWAARLLLARLLPPAPAPIPTTAPATAVRSEALLGVLAAAVREVLPVVVFGVAAYVLLTLLDLRPITRLVAIAAINANIIVRVVLGLARLLLDPRGHGHRLVPSLSDEDAAYGYVWLRRLVALPVYGYFAIEMALLIGLPQAVHAPLMTLLGFYLTALLIVLVLQSRRGVAQWLAGPEGEQATQRPTALRSLARVWHLIAIFYLVVIFAVMSLGAVEDSAFVVRATVVMVVVVALFRTVRNGAHRLVKLFLRVPKDLQQRYPTLDARVRRYETLLRQLTTGLLFVIAALLVLQAWSVDVAAALASSTGQALLSRLFVLLLIIGGVVLLWEGFSVVIESMLQERTPDGALRERSARLRTLLPLLLNTVRLVLSVLLALTVLSELGVNIAPLLAGAGVLGLAVGFGAQSLVRDIITGVFILLEDTITVGDVVTLGGHSGTVEKMSIRTIRLRDLSGNVHTLPYGEVTTILNMTEGFAWTVLDVGVAYREDTDAVVEELRAVAAALAEDPEFKFDLDGDFEVLGVDALTDSAVTIRVRQRTKPGKQWRIKRELNRRIKQRFDAVGIEIPFPHRTLYFGVAKDGSAPTGRIALEGPSAAD